MPVEINRNPNGYFDVNCRIQDALNIDDKDIAIMIIDKIVDEISKEILEKHSSELIAKINFETVANIAALELGKRTTRLIV